MYWRKMTASAHKTVADPDPSMPKIQRYNIMLWCHLITEIGNRCDAGLLYYFVQGCLHEFMVDPCHSGPHGEPDKQPKTVDECLTLCQANSMCKGVNYKPDNSTYVYCLCIWINGEKSLSIGLKKP